MTTADELNDLNAQIIAEFRANGGRVGGRFEGATLLLLHTTGARSGKERVNPLVCMANGDRLLVFASKAGAPTHPDWYHNLVAHPRVTVEVGAETYEATASTLEGEERDRIYAIQAERSPIFAEYQQKAGDRAIPIVALDRT